MKNTPVNEELITRYFSGNVTEEEQRTLLAWIAENPENEKQLFVMKDIYDAGAADRLFEEADTQAGWNKLQKQIASRKPNATAVPEKKKSLRLTGIMKYAAIFIFGLLIGSASLYLFSGSEEEIPSALCEVRTEKGERVTITLPDGSSVKLNACSYLAYPTDFGKEKRNLQFSGEGYFEVQTNADIPFTVETSGLKIKATGTAFNVKAYPDEDVVETTLVKGIVTVMNEKNQSIVTLKPDQMIAVPKPFADRNSGHERTEQAVSEAAKSPQPVVAKKTEAVLKDKITPEVYTSWKDDRWIIRSENLESLAKKMERKYNVTITLENDAVRKYVFTGTLRDYPLEQVLDIIQLNAPIRYSVKENNVVIGEEKQMKKKYEQLIHSPD